MLKEFQTKKNPSYPTSNGHQISTKFIKRAQSLLLLWYEYLVVGFST